jgi:hypothetical protein
VTHEDDVRQLLSFNDSRHIINVRCEPNGRGHVVSTVADPGEGHGKYAVTFGPKRGKNLLPAPRALPRAVHQNKIGHGPPHLAS